MYKIDTQYATAKQEVRQAFEICEAHARALIEFYQSVLTSLHIDRDCFIDMKLSDAAKEMVFLCRELMYGIPVAESFKLNLIDTDIIACVKDLKSVLNDEIKGLESYIDILQADPPSRLSAVKHWIYLSISKKKHEKLLNYVMVDHQETKKYNTDTKSFKINGYRSAIKMNATSEFFTDSMKELSVFVDDLGKYYDELITYSFEKQSCVVKSFDIEVISKPLMRQHEKYIQLKNEILASQDDDLSQTYINYFINFDKNINIEKLRESIDVLNKIVAANPKANSFMFMDKTLKIIYCAMILSNNLEKTLPSLESRLKHIGCIQFISAVDRGLQLLKAEAQAQRHDLEIAEAKITENLPKMAVVRSVENERLSPTEFDLPADVLEPSPPQTWEQTADSRALSRAKAHEDNKRKVKALDADTLAMFFQKPTPHLEMSHKQYYKFMESIGAKVNRSTGNGSAVKITLDPGSVLIAPSNDVTASGMSMHEQHNKGHKEKNLPSYVLKNTVEFFKRAGIYDFLLEQHQINHRPNETSSQSCKQAHPVLI